ncbi:MAG: hypothetical protein IKI65_02275 [Firmicutes bacterium]|nr:hypothetical protein [Bacillota bacterium]MBR4150754.1 hypothetical protein [Bacillota bacterium]
MPKYSEQDLKYAAEFREGIHKEALAIIRKTRPHASDVIDRHPVEDYFQESWEYPGRWYTVVAIPYGYKSRGELVDAIVKDTLCGNVPEAEPQQMREHEDVSDGEPRKGPFFQLLERYPDLAVAYSIVKCEDGYYGYGSHRTALKAAFRELCKGWQGEPEKAEGQKISAEELFSPAAQDGKLNYRRAFLDPPHGNGYTDRDFDLVNGALFPNGTDMLEVYEWTTDWSEYFDDGREWWGTLCITAYDPSLERFAVIMASETD